MALKSSNASRQRIGHLEPEIASLFRRNQDAVERLAVALRLGVTKLERNYCSSLAFIRKYKKLDGNFVEDHVGHGITLGIEVTI